MREFTREARIVGERQLPAGFARRSENSILVLITEPVIAADGMILVGPWDLASRYLPNPVVLWNHNREEWDRPSIGRAIQVVETEPGVVYAELEFDEDDVFAAGIARKYRRGYLSAVSIRWTSKEILHASKLDKNDPYYGQDAYIARGNALVEISAVNLGSLETAVAQRGASGAGQLLTTLLRAHPELRATVQEALRSSDQPTTTQPAPEDTWADWFPTNTQE